MNRETEFAALLRRQRRAAGLTQQTLAEKAFMSVEAIGALERGKRRYPRAETVRFIAEALRLTDEQLAELAAAAARPRRLQAGEGPMPPAIPGAPRQLPGAQPGFTGRRDEVDALIAWLTVDDARSATVCAIAGMGGVGKSALAVHVAHLVSSHFPDGQLFLNLRGYGPGDALSPAEAIGQLLRSLGVAPNAVPNDVDEASGVLRSMLSGRRVLIVLDNARNASHVAPMLPAAAGSAAIVTSRRVLSTLPGAHYLGLKVLRIEESLALLAESSGRERIDAEPEAALRAVRLCGGLPLAVRLVGSRLAARESWPVAYLADRLADERRTLDELGADDVDVRASFAVSIEQLARSQSSWDCRAAAAFPMLGLLDGPNLTTTVAARLLDIPERDAERILERLADAHLFDTPSPGRYQMHDLTRAYAREVAESLTDADRTAALTRVLDLYAGMAWQAYEHSQPGPRWPRVSRVQATPAVRCDDADQALDWVDAERPHILATMRQAAATGGVRGDLIVGLALELFGFYSIRTHTHDWLEVNRIAIPIAVAASDIEGAAWLRRHSSRAQIDLHRYPEAIAGLEESLADFISLGDLVGQSACLTALAIVLRRTGELDQALKYGTDAVATCKRSGDRVGEASARNVVGAIWWARGDRERGLAWTQASLEIWDEIGSDHDHVITLLNVGSMHREIGQLERSLTYLERCVTMIRQLSQQRSEAQALDQLGVTYLALGRYDAALGCFDEGVIAVDASTNRFGVEAGLQHHRGEALAGLGRATEARSSWRRALDLYGPGDPDRVDEVRRLLRATFPPMAIAT